MTETLLTNARLVLGDSVLDGSIVMRDGRIVAVDPGQSGIATAIDMEGDYLIPGIAGAAAQQRTVAFALRDAGARCAMRRGGRDHRAGRAVHRRSRL
jgi:imidazolonepropionase-like amidohydrolase